MPLHRETANLLTLPTFRSACLRPSPHVLWQPQSLGRNSSPSPLCWLLVTDQNSPTYPLPALGPRTKPLWPTPRIVADLVHWHTRRCGTADPSHPDVPTAEVDCRRRSRQSGSALRQLRRR